MKKIILTLVLAVFAMISVSQKPLSTGFYTEYKTKLNNAGKRIEVSKYIYTYLYPEKMVIKSIKFEPADLNDYFNPEEADWNATELNDKEIEYLLSKNVKWCDTVVHGQRFVGWYVVIRDTQTVKRIHHPKPKAKNISNKFLHV